jgi:hypothetical protein
MLPAEVRCPRPSGFAGGSRCGTYPHAGCLERRAACMIPARPGQKMREAALHNTKPHQELVANREIGTAYAFARACPNGAPPGLSDPGRVSIKANTCPSREKVRHVSRCDRGPGRGPADLVSKFASGGSGRDRQRVSVDGLVRHPTSTPRLIDTVDDFPEIHTLRPDAQVTMAASRFLFLSTPCSGRPLDEQRRFPALPSDPALPEERSYRSRMTVRTDGDRAS